MSEEEELAIEYLKRYTEWETHGERSLETDILTILNLIEKQQEINQVHQKINGELRIKVKELEKLLEEKTLRIGFENSDDYVSKDKIKEKIEVIQKRIKEETRTDFLITLKILENELQELLGE